MENYVRRHRILDMEADDELGVILLFEPLDKDKFKRCLRQIGYKPNTVKVENHNIYTDYYINKPTNFDIVDEVIERIANEQMFPIKINFDIGFVVEDTKEISYSRTHMDSNNGRATPSEIKDRDELMNYKTYIRLYISEKMEMTHQTSAHRFCAITGFLFHVVSLKYGKKE